VGRRKRPGPPQDGPPHWDLYMPHHALYWKFGGPFIPADKIEPAEIRPDQIGGGYKAARDRRRQAEFLLANAEKELAEHVASYLDFHERGIDALRNEWERVHDRRRAEKDENPDVPTEVSLRMSSHYQQIRYHKGRIIACTQVIAELDRAENPLFGWREVD
jgi:hypothetical protein